MFVNWLKGGREGDYNIITITIIFFLTALSLVLNDFGRIELFL